MDIHYRTSAKLAIDHYDRRYTLCKEWWRFKYTTVSVSEVTCPECLENLSTRVEKALTAKHQLPAVGPSGVATVEGVQRAVLAVPGVRSVRIDTLPGMVKLVVDGGIDGEVDAALLSVMPVSVSYEWDRP